MCQMNVMKAVVEPGEAARQRNKTATRQALIDAALWLFATKGYETTSTEEIAEIAGVSPRTFFRYFETKDRVLFFGGEAFNRAVLRDLPTQPAALREFDALGASVRAVAPGITPPKDRLRLYFRAIESSTVLLGQHASAQAQHSTSVASALATRRSLAQPDERCVLAAQLGDVAVARAYRVWLASRRDLAAVMDESFALVRTAVAADP